MPPAREPDALLLRRASPDCFWRLLQFQPPVRSKNKREFSEQNRIVATPLGSAVVIAPINPRRSGCHITINAFANPTGSASRDRVGAIVSRVDHVATGLGRRNSTRRVASSRAIAGVPPVWLAHANIGRFRLRGIGGGMGIISPAASFANLASLPERRLRAWQSNKFSSRPMSFDPASHDWWRYGDYLAYGELCQFGFAPEAALARLAVKQVLIPTEII